MIITGQGKGGEGSSKAESIPGAAERAEDAEHSQESPAPAHHVLFTVQEQFLPKTTSLSVE